MCVFEAPSVALLLSHLRLLHSNDPRFLVRCGIEPGCSYTARTFSALYSHVYRKHKQAGIISSRSSNTGSEVLASNEINHTGSIEQCFDQSTSCRESISEINQAEIDHLLGTDQEKQKRASALFLLKLKESKQVSQVVIDEIISEWHTLFSHTTLRIQAGVRASLAAAGIDSSTLPGLNEVFDNIPKPFDGLETRFKQEKYYRESLFLVVSVYINKASIHLYIPFPPPPSNFTLSSHILSPSYRSQKKLDLATQSTIHVLQETNGNSFQLMTHISTFPFLKTFEHCCQTHL